MGPIYEYFDYRKFLKDLIALKQQSNKTLSLRAIAQRAGIDPSHLTKVLNGKRNLSSEHTFQLAKTLHLKKSETNYFHLLTRFNQARGKSERTTLFEQILTYQKAKVTSLPADAYEYYSQWYYIVIRELLNFYPFDGDLEELGSLLIPKIGASEVQRALGVLERLGIIKKDTKGLYALTDQFVTTDTTIQTIALRNFQRKMIERGKVALERFSKERRDISCLTVSISQKTFDRIRDRIAEFRHELMELCAHDEDPDSVYQMNFQLFPASSPFKEKQQ